MAVAIAIEEIDLEGLEGADLEYLTVKQRDDIPDSDYAWPDAPGRPKYPIDTQDHLDAAAKLIGRAPADKQASIKARAIKIAKRNKLTLPKSWQDEKQEATESIDVPSPDLSPRTPPKSRIARIKVKWLEDDAISLNGRQYPESAVNRLVQSAQAQLSDPNALPLTCYISHAKADEDDSTKITGRVTDVWKEGKDALAYIDIPDTHVGRDVASLTSNGYLNTMSLRASGAELKLDKQRGIPQVSGDGLVLNGIDLTANPGIPEARIQQVLLESADRAGICEVFDLTQESLILETQTQEKHMDIREEVIPSTTSGVTVGVTSDPTDDDYHKSQYADIPPMLANDVTDPMAGSLIREAHDHIAMVQGRECGPSRESARGQALLKKMQEAGRALSGKNNSHLDAAHDNIAKALGMECEGANNKSMKTVDPDNDGDAELAGYDRKANNMEAKKPMENQAKITTDDALKLLEAHGFKIQHPKTREELLQEEFDRKLEAQQKAMQEAMEAKITALSEQFATVAAKNEPTPQRKSLVEGATTTSTKPAHQRPAPRKNGDYLKEQLKDIPFEYLADRSFPLPEGVNVERLLEEMKLPLLGMYDEKYGLV